MNTWSTTCEWPEVNQISKTRIRFELNQVDGGSVPVDGTTDSRPVCDGASKFCDGGMFCNNDIGPNNGFCENCGDFMDPSSCDNSGLPALGANECKA